MDAGLLGGSLNCTCWPGRLTWLHTLPAGSLCGRHGDCRPGEDHPGTQGHGTQQAPCPFYHSSTAGQVSCSASTPAACMHAALNVLRMAHLTADSLNSQFNSLLSMSRATDWLLQHQGRGLLSMCSATRRCSTGLQAYKWHLCWPAGQDPAKHGAGAGGDGD